VEDEIDMRGKTFEWMMAHWDIHPVLIDVGASGAPPYIWKKIARRSIYVGFDPDSREMHENSKSHFYKIVIVRKAITSDQRNDDVTFFFTKSPCRSSTLEPDARSLTNYLCSDPTYIERRAIFFHI